MKKQIFLVALIFAILFSSQLAFAQTKINFTNIKNYNLPDAIGKLIGDARVNIYDYENNALGSMAVLNGTINQTSDELLDSPTHKIFAQDARTLQNIFDAESFTKEFNRQRSLHNIRIEAIDFIDQIKLTIGTWIIAIISLFISPE